MTDNAQTLATQTLRKGIVKTLKTESKLLSAIPFIDMEGTSYNYNLESQVADAKFRGLYEGYGTDSDQHVFKTEQTKKLIKEARVDDYEQKGVQHSHDLMAGKVEAATRALANSFTQAFVGGNEDQNPLEFNGLKQRVLASKTFEGTSNIIDDIELAISEVAGEATHLVMSKRTALKLGKAARENQNYDRRVNEFGKKITMYGDVDIIDVSNDLLNEGEVFAVRFDQNDGVTGIQYHEGIMVQKLGHAEGFAGEITRLQWFPGLAVLNPKAIVLVQPAAEPVVDPAAE